MLRISWIVLLCFTVMPANADEPMNDKDKDKKLETLPKPKPTQENLPVLIIRVPVPPPPDIYPTIVISPAPVIISPIMPSPIPAYPGFYRPDSWEHWQNLAPSRTGYLRPRVILAPQPYYRANGAPYPFYPSMPEIYSP